LYTFIYSIVLIVSQMKCFIRIIAFSEFYSFKKHFQNDAL